MSLSNHASFPHTHSFVLKLHSDAAPERGQVFGRLQHIYSGQQCEFATAEELLACIARGAALTQAASRDARLDYASTAPPPEISHETR